MSLDIPGAATPSVTRKGNAERINRHDPNKNKQHYKWIIDLENPEEMHQKPLTLVRNVFKPILRIRTGEFYAQELSTVPYECIKGNMERKDFGYVASIIGVNIAELPEMKAILKLGALSFPFSAKNDQTAFEIKFSNKRPLKKVDMHALHKAHISDFPYYYHAFNVSALERFDFDFAESPTDNTHEGTKENDGVPPAVCYSSGGRFPPG